MAIARVTYREPDCISETSFFQELPPVLTLPVTERRAAAVDSRLHEVTFDDFPKIQKEVEAVKARCFEELDKTEEEKAALCKGGYYFHTKTSLAERLHCFQALHSEALVLSGKVSLLAKQLLELPSDDQEEKQRELITAFDSAFGVRVACSFLERHIDSLNVSIQLMERASSEAGSTIFFHPITLDIAQALANNKRFEKGETLGKGTYGIVKQVHIADHRFALKVFDSFTCGETEAAHHLAVSHFRGCTPVYFSGSIGSNYVMIMDLATSTIGKKMKSTFFTHERVVLCMREVLYGLSSLSYTGLIHYDIAPDNVLLFEHDGKISVRISDFSLARASKLSRGAQKTRKEYTPPELLGKTPIISRRSDIWMAGVLFFYVLTGQLPFSKRFIDMEGIKFKDLMKRRLDEILAKTDVSNRLDRLDEERRLIRFVIDEMFEIDPEKRKFSSELLKSDVFEMDVTS